MKTVWLNVTSKNPDKKRIQDTIRTAAGLGFGQGRCTLVKISKDGSRVRGHVMISDRVTGRGTASLGIYEVDHPDHFTGRAPVVTDGDAKAPGFPEAALALTMALPSARTYDANHPRIRHPTLGWGRVDLVTDTAMRVRFSFNTCVAWFSLDSEALATWPVENTAALASWIRQQ